MSRQDRNRQTLFVQVRQVTGKPTLHYTDRVTACRLRKYYRPL